MSTSNDAIGLTKAGVVVTNITTGIAQVTFTNSFEKGVNYSVSLSTPDPGGVGTPEVIVYADRMTNIGFSIASYTTTGGTNNLVIAGGKTVYWTAVPMFD